MSICPKCGKIAGVDYKCPICLKHMGLTYKGGAPEVHSYPPNVQARNNSMDFLNSPESCLEHDVWKKEEEIEEIKLDISKLEKEVCDLKDELLYIGFSVEERKKFIKQILNKKGEKDGNN